MTADNQASQNPANLVSKGAVQEVAREAAQVEEVVVVAAEVEVEAVAHLEELGLMVDLVFLKDDRDRSSSA
jgi:hypothetical protein